MSNENGITRFQAEMIIRCLCDMARTDVDPGRLNIMRATLIHNCRKVNADVIEKKQGWLDVIFGRIGVGHGQ